MLYPILLEPVFKDYLWGDSKLRWKYGKNCSFERISESWELSTHEEGVCGVSNGKHAGKLFSEYLQEEGPGILGRSVTDGELPVLIKLIDTADTLSVQVHPDDAYARTNGGARGKTEFWYIMDCEEGAQLYYGVKEGVERDEFASRAREGTITDVLNLVDVHPGDAFFVPPGTVHAIGRGMTVAEVGTNCNITYRIYDFDRTDADGNPRDLHIDQAADVYRPGAPNLEWVDGVIDCGPFRQTLVELHGILDIQPDEDSFQCLICVDGEFIIDRSVHMSAGMSAFIPAGLAYTLNGDATVLITSV